MCDGRALKGMVVFFCPSDLSVVLTHPFSGIASGSHTPAFAMYPQNRNIDDRGAITPKGFAAIERCLVAAYRQALALHENRETLYARILEAKQAVDAIQKEQERFENLFRAEKHVKKWLFKQGLLREREYALYLKSGRDRIAKLQDRVRDSKRRAFEGYADIDVAYGQEERAMAFVLKHFSSYLMTDNV
jgi:hypothetical protein